MDPKKHDKLIGKTLSDIQAGVFDNMKALEERIAELILAGGSPEILRPQIMREFEVFQASIKQEANKVKALSAETGVDTPEDSQAVDALARQTGNNMAKEFLGGAETVMTGLVVGAAAGIAADRLATQARASISGVMLTSTDREVRRMQKILKKTGATPEERAEATRRIRDRLTGVNTTASLRDLTAKTVESAVMKFDGAYTIGKARREGKQRFRYTGGLSENSRGWCMEHEEQVYTEDEIYDLWDSMDWAGKEPGDPFVVRGGYNCRHFWVPVDDDE